MIAEDFARVRVLATESIATPMVEGARTPARPSIRGPLHLAKHILKAAPEFTF